MIIDREENFHSVSIRGTTSAHDQGWAVLYLESGKRPMLSTIGLDGTGVDYPIEFPPQLIQRTTLVSASASRHLFFVQQQFGFAVYSVDNGFVRARGVHGVGPASQRGAEIGHGPGVDLVVWTEPSFSGLSLRGTRVRNGVPLDGPGFLLGSATTGGVHYPPPVVVFDGEAFLVAWVEEVGTISLRRVGIDGYVFETFRLEALPTAGTSGDPALDLASRHDGAALLTWSEGHSGSDVASSLITRGVPGPVTVPMFPNVWISTGAASFNGDHFLLVGSSRAKYCQTEAGCMPPPPREVWSRILNPDGTPGGPAVLVEAFPFATQQKPLPFEDGWIVPVNHVEGVQQGNRGQGSRLVRVTGSGIPYRENGVIGDELLETAEGPMVWSDRFRGMIDGELRPIWFEPLPVEDPFGNYGPLSDGAFLVVQDDTRLVVRSATPHPLRADLGILITRSREAGVRVETIVVQHQGGDVIPAIHIGIVGGERYLGGWNVDHPDVSDRSSIGSIKGPFAPGDSVNFVIRWASETHRDLFIWALPDARDEDAEDNFVTLPAVERRRLIGRGVE